MKCASTKLMTTPVSSAYVRKQGSTWSSYDWGMMINACLISKLSAQPFDQYIKFRELKTARLVFGEMWSLRLVLCITDVSQCKPLNFHWGWKQWNWCTLECLLPGCLNSLFPLYSEKLALQSAFKHFTVL